jgi:YbbR domain-containing protein
MSEKSKTTEWFSDALTKNLGFKALAIVLALVFFYTRETESISHRTLSIPVIAMLDPAEERILVSGFPEQVTLRLQGPVSVLKELRGQDVGPAVVPIQEIRDKQFRFTRQNFNLPDAAKITMIYPESVPVQFEDRIQKKVPLLVEIKGMPAPGRFLSETITIAPEKVSISGARSSVQHIENWDTEPVFVDELGPGKHVIDLTLAPPKLANVFIEHEPTATVTIEVLQREMAKWIRKVPVGVEGIDPVGITMKPPTISVYVKGPEEVVKFLDVDMLNFYCTLTDEELITVGSYPKVIEHAVPPEGVSFVKIVPSKAIVINRSPAALKAEAED